MMVTILAQESLYGVGWMRRVFTAGAMIEDGVEIDLRNKSLL
jgi:hypothetical protein